jgi:hypothetical protein
MKEHHQSGPGPHLPDPLAGLDDNAPATVGMVKILVKHLMLEITELVKDEIKSLIPDLYKRSQRKRRKICRIQKYEFMIRQRFFYGFLTALVSVLSILFWMFVAIHTGFLYHWPLTTIIIAFGIHLSYLLVFVRYLSRSTGN